MKVALISNDNKMELMRRFCLAYGGILCCHKLYATSTTGVNIEKTIGVNVIKYMDSEVAGYEQISLKIYHGEIDMLIFFRDPTNPNGDSAHAAELLRLCDSMLVPYATNIATAEILIHGLERGELEWRNIGQPNGI